MKSSRAQAHAKWHKAHIGAGFITGSSLTIDGGYVA